MIVNWCATIKLWAPESIARGELGCGILSCDPTTVSNEDSAENLRNRCNQQEKWNRKQKQNEETNADERNCSAYEQLLNLAVKNRPRTESSAQHEQWVQVVLSFLSGGVDLQEISISMSIFLPPLRLLCPALLTTFLARTANLSSAPTSVSNQSRLPNHTLRIHLNLHSKSSQLAFTTGKQAKCHSLDTATQFSRTGALRHRHWHRHYGIRVPGLGFCK